MKKLLLAGLVGASLLLGGCTAFGSFAAGTATDLSSSSPSQVTTLAQATAAADLVTLITKAAVDTGKLDLGTLTELQALRSGVRAAMNDLVTANAKGQSIDFAAFNAALDAYRAYQVLKGIDSTPPAASAITAPMARYYGDDNALKVALISHERIVL